MLAELSTAAEGALAGLMASDCCGSSAPAQVADNKPLNVKTIPMTLFIAIRADCQSAVALRLRLLNPVTTFKV